MFFEKAGEAIASYHQFKRGRIGIEHFSIRFIKEIVDVNIVSEQLILHWNYIADEYKKRKINRLERMVNDDKLDEE